MKEKIIAILKDSYRSLTYKDPDTGDIKSTTALMITSEQFPRIADKIEHLINAEMPTEEEIQKHIETTRFMDGTPSMDEQTFYEGAKWFRNRMSSSEKPNNCTGGEEK
jgi:hypothetical protein